MKQLKKILIKVAKGIVSLIFGNRIAFFITNKVINSPQYPYIRCVNYHDTPKMDEVQFEKQLIWIKQNFINCDLIMLRDLMNDGKWSQNKPGIIISFDDGLKTNYDIAAPLLEKHGFTGWFMIPVAFPKMDIITQHLFASSSKILHSVKDSKQPVAMSWDNINDLERNGHFITCHTMNHKWLSDKLGDDEFNEEIVLSKKELEYELGHEVTGFTWVGGNESAYSKRAFEFIKSAGYKEVFCTNSELIKHKTNNYFIERSNLHSNNSLNQVRLVLGGLYDIKYKRKKNRIFERLNN